MNRLWCFCEGVCVQSGQRKECLLRVEVSTDQRVEWVEVYWTCLNQKPFWNILIGTERGWNGDIYNRGQIVRLCGHTTPHSTTSTCSLEAGSLCGSMVSIFRSSVSVWRCVISPSMDISSSWDTQTFISCKFYTKNSFETDVITAAAPQEVWRESCSTEGVGVDVRQRFTFGLQLLTSSKA